MVGVDTSYFHQLNELTPEEYYKYFLKIQRKGDKKKIPFKLNTGQKKILKAVEDAYIRHGFWGILLKARQFGGSTLVQGEIFRRHHLNPGLSAEVIAHKSTAATNMWNKSIYFYNNFPQELVPKLDQKQRGKVIAFKDYDSRIRFSSAEHGSEPGVSDTLNMLHCTEFALWATPEATLDALLPTVPDDENSFVILESTARGYNYFHDIWEGATTKERSLWNGYTPIFVGWLDIEDYQLFSKDRLTNLTEEERVLQKVFGATSAQLKWRRATIKRQYNNSIERFNQEFPATPEDAFVSSGNCLFDSALCKKRYDETKDLDPAFKGWIFSNGQDLSLRENIGGPLWIWQKPESKQRYIIAADCAGPEVVNFEKKEGDLNVAVVFQCNPFKQVATYRSKDYAKEYADVLMALGRYYNDAMVCVERNPGGNGTAVLEQMMDKYLYLYSEERHDLWSPKFANYPGWLTKSTNRMHMLSSLQTATNESPDAFIDHRFWKECMTVVQKKGGKWEHEDGAHDDIVMASAIAVQMITHGQGWGSKMVRGEGFVERPFTYEGNILFHRDAEGNMILNAERLGFGKGHSNIIMGEGYDNL